jgi:flagellar biogenesis protein FliO
MVSFCPFLIAALSLTSSAWWRDYAKTMLILVAICLIALLMARTLGPKLRNLTAASSGRIHVFAKHSLEPRKNLYLVRAGKAVLLLATSEHAVHFMKALDAADFEDGPQLVQDDVNISANRFANQTIAERTSGRPL